MSNIMLFPFCIHIRAGEAYGGCCLVAKSCPTLYNPTDSSPPGSSVPGISQARILEWVDISFSRGSSRSRDRIRVSCIGRRILDCLVTREI